MKNKDFRIFVIVIAIFSLYFVMDYFNIPCLLGIESSNINMNLFDIFFNSLIAVVLFLITYFAIDKKQVQKEENTKQTANVLMLSSYKKCRETIILLDDNAVIKAYIVPKVDFDKTGNDNFVVKSIKEQPFVILEHVLQLSENGYVSRERLKTFLAVVDDYKSYVSFKITFFDIEDAETPEQKGLKKYIEEKRDKLLKIIDDEINVLEKNKE